MNTSHPGRARGAGARRAAAAGVEAAAGVAFVLLLVVGCAALGLAIAWPLWAFATAARQASCLFEAIIAPDAAACPACRGLTKDSVVHPIPRLAQ